MRAIIILLVILFTRQSQAQEIAGKVVDGQNRPIMSAVVQVLLGGIVKGGAATDSVGNYSMLPLEAGYYDLMVLVIGCDTSLITGILVSPHEKITANIVMQTQSDHSAVHIDSYYRWHIGETKIEAIPTSLSLNEKECSL